MQIDLLIIKKEKDQKIEKNIGQIFRTHNIVEYKGPGDSFSIDDFYKVHGYACIFKSITEKVNEIAAEEITLTIAVNQFPRDMLKELQRSGNFQVVKFDEGIYHISGGMFPIQIIHTVSYRKKIISG